MEDKISALTTQDPEKLKVYLDKFDGHCLRAFAYFGDQMEGIDPLSAASINAIEEKYPDLRQASKPVTFLLTYQGTWMGLMQNCGMDEATAKAVEARYHKLYHVSDQWVQTHIDRALTTGYVECAFGLRVRTPLLGATLKGKMTQAARKESRTAGNALGQSWGMLNNRAAIEFQQRTLASKYALDVLPCAHIHDAQYFLVRNDLDVIEFVSNELSDCMSWQDDPLIAHDQVKLSGALSLFYPDWSKECKLKPQWSQEIIKEACDTHVANL